MCLAATINKDATVMWHRQLREAIHFSQSTPLHRLMMQLSTVVNCRWIGHRWNLLISRLCRLGAEGWLNVWKVKRLRETWAGMSLPSASSLPHQSPSISIQVIVLSNYQTQTTKGGAIWVFTVCPWAFCAVTATHKRQLWLQKCNPKISCWRKCRLSSPVMSSEVRATLWKSFSSQPAFASITFSYLSCLLRQPVSHRAY